MIHNYIPRLWVQEVMAHLMLSVSWGGGWPDLIKTYRTKVLNSFQKERFHSKHRRTCVNCSCNVSTWDKLTNTVEERGPVHKSQPGLRCSSLADAEQMRAPSELMLQWRCEEDGAKSIGVRDRRAVSSLPHLCVSQSVFNKWGGSPFPLPYKSPAL